MENGPECVHLQNLQASCIEAHATAQCRCQTAWLRAQLSTASIMQYNAACTACTAQHSVKHPPASCRCPAAPPPAAPGRGPKASGCPAPARQRETTGAPQAAIRAQDI